MIDSAWRQWGVSVGLSLLVAAAIVAGSSYVFNTVKSVPRPVEEQVLIEPVMQRDMPPLVERSAVTLYLPNGELLHWDDVVCPQTSSGWHDGRFRFRAAGVTQEISGTIVVERRWYGNKKEGKK